jgi:hypothetical protein
MKDLTPEEPVELIEMKVQLGMSCLGFVLIIDEVSDTPQGTEEEAAPPAPFQFHNWDE